MSHSRAKLFVKFSIFLSTGFGAGFLPELLPSHLRHRKWAERWTGSGFLGTVIAVFLGFLAPLEGVFGLLLLLTCSGLAIYLSGIAEVALGTKDDHRIVIDEIIGYFWSVAFVPYESFPRVKKLVFIIAAFALFRCFDVFKIPSRRVQNLPGGWGVMMDDILSGMTVNVLLHVALRFWN